MRKKTRHIDPFVKIKERFSEENGFGKYTDIAVELLKKTISILDNHKIGHLLISGTLLGHVRHNGFIPWDDDMDLLVDNSILSKLDAILEENREEICILNRNGHIKFCFVNHGINVLGAWSGLWGQYVLNSGATYKWPFIDLFIHEALEEFGEITGWPDFTFFGNTWESDKFYPAKQVSFMGVDVMIPNTPEYFLSKNFGEDYMTVYKSSRYIHKKEQMGPASVTINKDTYDTIIGNSDGPIEK